MNTEELRQKIKDAIYPCSAHCYFSSPKNSTLEKKLDKSVEQILEIIKEHDQTTKA